MSVPLDFTKAQKSLLRDNLDSYGYLDDASLLILQHGWAAATTRQYSAAVNKYFTFLESIQHIGRAIPAPESTIYRFILWCCTQGKNTVLSKTTTRYLTGLKMWHVLNDKRFPEVNLHRIRLLLKGCQKNEVPRVAKERTGLSLEDMLHLCDRLTSNNNVDLVVKAILLTGFWGLARLRELTLNRDHPDVFIRRRDVVFSKDGKSACIKIRLAKTAAPNEVQLIRLRAQPNRLDPINVLYEVIQRIPGTADDPLFPGKFTGIPITKSVASGFLKANGPTDSTYWSGHSLRIGGASFRTALGSSVENVKLDGWWRSSAYKVYVRRYSAILKARTLELAALIHF